MEVIIIQGLSNENKPVIKLISKEFTKEFTNDIYGYHQALELKKKLLKNYHLRICHLQNYHDLS